jgi:hypothetical protein
MPAERRGRVVHLIWPDRENALRTACGMRLWIYRVLVRVDSDEANPLDCVWCRFVKSRAGLATPGAWSRQGHHEIAGNPQRAVVLSMESRG